MAARTDVPTQEGSEGSLDLVAAVRGTGLALVVATLGALAVALAPLLPVVSPVAARAGGGSSAAAISVAVAVLAAPALGAVLLRGGHVVGALGALFGAGGIAAGLAVADLQLFVGALDANRLELFRPTSASPLGAGPGAVVVLAGHGLVVVAAVLGVVTARRSGVLEDPEAAGNRIDEEGPVLRRAGRFPVTLVVACTAVLAVAGFLPPLTSSDPVILVPAVVQSPAPVVASAVLLALAVAVTAALALVSTSLAGGAAALTAAALLLASVHLPRLLAAVSVPGVGPGVGSWVGAVTAVLLVLGAAGLVVSSRRRDRRAADVDEIRAQLPGSTALHRATGVCGVLAGGAAVLASLLPVVSTGSGITTPEVDQVKVLLLGGVLLAAASVAMVGRLAPAVRPVVGVLWLGVVLGGGGVLQAALVATEVTGVSWGVGAVLTVVAVLAALVCGALAGLAGAAEREDWDTSARSGAAGVDRVRPLLVLVVLGGLAGVLGLVLPLCVAPGFTAPGVTRGAPLTGAWGWDTWSLVLVALALVVVLAVVPRARAPRSVALLVGTTLVLALHLVSWPLTCGRVPGGGAGPGVVLTGVAVVLLVAATWWVASRHTIGATRDPTGRGGPR
ncbi:MAG: hypothetical protein ABI181_03165 [Mycobacteriaceae bacterium]